MLIISFAWTAPQLLAGKKTVTRRAWDDHYAERFIRALERGEEIQAYDKSPRYKGKCVGFCRLISVRKMPLDIMTDDDELREGGLWGSAKAFIEANREHLGDKPWRIEFSFRPIEEGMIADGWEKDGPCSWHKRTATTKGLEI